MLTETSFGRGQVQRQGSSRHQGHALRRHLHYQLRPGQSVPRGEDLRRRQDNRKVSEWWSVQLSPPTVDTMNALLTHSTDVQVVPSAPHNSMPSTSCSPLLRHPQARLRGPAGHPASDLLQHRTWWTQTMAKKSMGRFPGPLHFIRRPSASCRIVAPLQGVVMHRCQWRGV